MKTTAFTVLSVLGLVLFSAPAALAHSHTNDRAVHQQRRLADHQRHDTGISWQQDRQIHRQERAGHRLQHQFNNQYGAGYAGYYGGNYGSSVNQNLYPGYQSYQTGYPSYQQQYPSWNTPVYGNGYGQQTINGHSYSGDGHRFDHHGNHDDGRFDR